MEDQQLHQSLKQRRDFLECNRFWVAALSLEGSLLRLESTIDELIVLLETIGLPKPASDDNDRGIDTELVETIITKLDHLASLSSLPAAEGLDP